MGDMSTPYSPKTPQDAQSKNAAADPAAPDHSPVREGTADSASLREITSRESKYRGYVVDVAVEKFLLTPTGPELTRDCVGMPGAVVIAALNDRDEILLVNQYRHPVRMNLWEVPGGLLDNAGEDPLRAARRELAEEADLVAERWDTLVDYYSSPGITDEAGRIYLARQLSEVPAGERHQRRGEESEMIYRWVPLHYALELVLGGKVHNALTNQAIMACYIASQQGFAGLRNASESWDFHPYLGGRRSAFLAAANPDNSADTA